MPSIHFLCILLLLAIELFSRCESRSRHWESVSGDAPRFTVNMDLPPEERWIEAMTTQIRRHGWEYSFKPSLDFVEQVFPIELWKKYDAELQLVAGPIVGSEVEAELRGILKAATDLGYGENITLSELEFIQIFYEILMQCTGILGRDASGSVYHGRNMDMGLWVENVTAQIIWTKGNTTVFESTQYLGYNGVHTGMRSGKGWSVQANERVILTPGPYIGYEKSSLLLTVAAFLEGHRPLGLVLRDALMNAETYDKAIPILETVPLASPVYFIVGSATNGTVLTRDRRGLATESQDTTFYGHQKVPDVGGARRDMSAWYEVQTNWDPWIRKSSADCRSDMATWNASALEECSTYIKDVYGDQSGECTDICQLYSDGRSEAANASMASQSANGNVPSEIFEALTTPPVMTSITKFTALMSPARGTYNTTVHYRSLPSRFEALEATDGKTLDALRFFVRSLAKIPGL